MSILKKVKTARQLERHLKGVANHRRIEILFLVAERGGVTLDGIARGVGANLKTVAEHTRRLVQAGLLDKRYEGRNVAHTLSPYGKTFLAFLRTFSHS